jgi:hypothetical protein
LLANAAQPSRSDYNTYMPLYTETRNLSKIGRLAARIPNIIIIIQHAGLEAAAKMQGRTIKYLAVEKR